MMGIRDAWMDWKLETEKMGQATYCNDNEDTPGETELEK